MSKCGPFGTIGRPFFFPLNPAAFLSSFHFLFFSSSFPFLSPSSCDSFLLLFKTERRRAILPGEKTSSSSLQIPTLGGAGWEVINLDEEEGEEHSSSSSASSVKNNGNKKKIKSRRKMTSWRERNRRMKLIRFLILAILLLLFWRYYSSSSSSSSSNDLTSLSSSLLLQDKRIEPFFFRASSSSSSSSTETEIVLLTHLTVDRLQSLVEMVKAWQHPLSVSILIRNNEDIETLMKVRSESEILKQFADIHLYIQLEQVCNLLLVFVFLALVLLLSFCFFFFYSYHPFLPPSSLFDRVPIR